MNNSPRRQDSVTQLCSPKLKACWYFALLFLVDLSPSLCLHFLFCGKEKGLERHKRHFIGQKLARPHISASLVCRATGGDEPLPLGSSWRSVNSRFLNFTQQFTGCEEGKLGNLSSGAALSNENLLGFPFLPS